MVVVRQAGTLLLAALLTSRGLFAQDPVDTTTAPEALPGSPASAAAIAPVDQVKVLLRPTEIHYVQQESVLLPPTANIKALYVNAWAFGSPKLWQLVQEAAQMGFREVQFDYVRFPDEPRERMATAIFPAHRSGQTQREAVRKHVALLKDRLRPFGVPVTFDIFGLTASVTTGDLGIGQVWEDFVSVADVVLPMVYPSHYYRGAFGYAWPNGQPYHVVRSALIDALKRSEPLPGSAEIRPFLQAFTLGRRLPRYTPFEIREQIRAAEDLGITSWVLWNPRSVYQRGSLRPKHDSRSPETQTVSSVRGGR